VFWIGVGVLTGGIILFGYGSLTVPSLFEEMRELYTHLVETAVNTGMGPSPVQILEARLFLMQLLQLIGLGMAAMGAIMLAYGLWAEKENK
jgi:hypothetical protein